MTTQGEPSSQDENDRPDWWEQGFDTLAQAENAWQCEQEARGEDAAENGHSDEVGA